MKAWLCKMINMTMYSQDHDNDDHIIGCIQYASENDDDGHRHHNKKKKKKKKHRCRQNDYAGSQTCSAQNKFWAFSTASCSCSNWSLSLWHYTFSKPVKVNSQNSHLQGLSPIASNSAHNCLQKKADLGSELSIRTLSSLPPSWDPPSRGVSADPTGRTCADSGHMTPKAPWVPHGQVSPHITITSSESTWISQGKVHSKLGWYSDIRYYQRTIGDNWSIDWRFWSVRCFFCIPLSSCPFVGRFQLLYCGNKLMSSKCMLQRFCQKYPVLLCADRQHGFWFRDMRKSHEQESWKEKGFTSLLVFIAKRGLPSRECSNHAVHTSGDLGTKKSLFLGPDRIWPSIVPKPVMWVGLWLPGRFRGKNWRSPPIFISSFRLLVYCLVFSGVGLPTLKHSEAGSHWKMAFDDSWECTLCFMAMSVCVLPLRPLVRGCRPKGRLKSTNETWELVTSQLSNEGLCLHFILELRSLWETSLECLKLFLRKTIRVFKKDSFHESW